MIVYLLMLGGIIEVQNGRFVSESGFSLSLLFQVMPAPPPPRPSLHLCGLIVIQSWDLCKLLFFFRIVFNMVFFFRPSFGADLYIDPFCLYRDRYPWVAVSVGVGSFIAENRTRRRKNPKHI